MLWYISSCHQLLYVCMVVSLLSHMCGLSHWTWQADYAHVHVSPGPVEETWIMMHCLGVFHELLLYIIRQGCLRPYIVQNIAGAIKIPSSNEQRHHFPDGGNMKRPTNIPLLWCIALWWGLVWSNNVSVAWLFCYVMQHDPVSVQSHPYIPSYFYNT